MVKPSPKPKSKFDAGGTLDELFKLNKGQIVNAPDTSAVWIERERLEPNPMQPRRRFDAHAIAELGDNMKAVGQIEAITVRPHPDAATIGAKQNVFQIVAGERRWRAAAAQFGNLPKLRCVIRNLNDTEVLAIALSENAHRTDVSPIEFARGLAQLKETSPGGTWDVVLEQVKISRPRLFQLTGLLKLPEAIQERIDGGELNEKHGRALLEFPNDSPEQQRLLFAIDEGKLSGNAASDLAKRMREEAAAPKVYPGIPGSPQSTSTPVEAASGQTAGSGFDTSGGTSSGATSTRTQISGTAQASAPKDIIQTLVKPATSYVAEARRRVQEDKPGADYRRKLKAELALLDSHIQGLKEELS